MIIRKAKKKDFKRIGEILTKEYNKKPYEELWNEEIAKKQLNFYSRHSKIFVAEINDIIAGFIIIHEGMYMVKLLLIDELAVDSKYQRKGVGKELMKFAEDYCKKHEIKLIQLFANKKAKAYQFYKKLGYKELEEATFMVKNI